MTNARLLADALRDPQTVLALQPNEWAALLTMAHAERLSASLAHRLDGLPLPDAARRVLEGARADAEMGRTHALWEAEMARRALLGCGLPVILLKGTAYAAAGLDAGQGRFIGDLDILVPRASLARAEAALLESGWEWVKPDPYDDAYYRRWMHELPPLIHRTRDRMIDVHHTILPLTARPRPNAAALIESSVALENGLRVLAPEDMVLHAVAHLLADGDLAGGLRNLWDIDRLLRELASEPGFWQRLHKRAALHGLARHLRRALRLSRELFGAPVEGTVTIDAGDAFYLSRLTARDGWGRETRRPLRFAYYLRSHWIRMPPLMLARHLLAKARRQTPQRLS